MGSSQASRTRRATVLSAAAGVGLVAVLALAPAAAFTASRMPAPLTVARLELPGGEIQQATRIRQVPVGLPRGTQIRSVADVRPYAVAATGADAADRLLGLLAAPDEGFSWPSLEPSTQEYPYRFAAVDRVLRTAPPDQLARNGSTFGAALLLLAVATGTPSGLDENAGRMAFAVLDHVREEGCEPGLNLLALVASDPETSRAVLARESVAASRACPRDPTPGWLVSQASMQALSGDLDGTELETFHVTSLREAERNATAFVRDFPADPGALATLGDYYLTAGRYLAGAQPFTSRRAFRDAETVFARLRRAGGESLAAQLGAARAELGLARPDRAAALATGAVEASARPARALQLAVSTQEKARRFDLASALAKRLADLGSDAFPPVTAIIPLGPPLTLGSDTLTDASVPLLAGGQGGGGTVADEGFVPRYRESYGLTNGADACPDWVWRRDALLAGDAAGAARGWPAEFTPTDPRSFAGTCPGGGPLKEQIDSRLQGSLPEDVGSDTVRDEVESLLDERQNLLRWAGDLTGARREALAWAQHLGDRTALAHQRLGEIAYLLEEYDTAATDFGEAAARWRMLSSTNDLAVDQALLAQAAALLRTGRADQGVALLRPLVLEGAEGYGYQSSLSGGSVTAREFAKVSYYAATLLGNHELAAGRSRAASDDFRTALLWSTTLKGEVHLDATRNSAAIAALDTGDRARAASLSRAAVAGDPRSPVYLMTSAEVARQSGDVANGIRQNRAALESDPSDYPAANNLAVLLARQGSDAEASRVLRGAVHAHPDYALGWFNLGVVEGRRGPAHVVPSQGALARAAALDPASTARPHRPTLDTTTYRTALDVSKPLPAGWSFAGSQARAPVITIGLLAAALAGVGLLPRREGSPPPVAKDWLDGVGSRLARVRGMRRLRRLRRPGWAVAATVGAFLLAFGREHSWPWTGVAYAVGLVALVATGMLVRDVVARRRTGGAVQGTWAPGVLVGLVSGAFGAPIAPYPVVRAPVRSAAVAVAAPLTMALLSLVLLLEASLLHVPLTVSFCVAAFVMAGSLLIPVQPLDGSRARRAGVVGAAGLLGAVLVLGLGLL